ncbi:MAG: radical SAM family heme chaperone HemW [Proteobacteria bacterium]|nr:radical SAM family heme chaperone HemW [Pseudomonadota bacterium]
MLLTDFARSQRLENIDIANDFGIYIHVPFCLRRCRYCAFVSSVWREVPSELYANAICREFDIRCHSFDNAHLTTIYFGGGTPSILNDHALETILSHIRERYPAPLEITLEANPEHITPQRSQHWKQLGFTRISLGIQSFDDQMLEFLGRRHTGSDAQKAIDILTTAGFDEISIDLIYGARISDETSDAQAYHQWMQDLGVARSMNVSHVSCYELTPEEFTPLCTAQKRGHTILCSDDAIADMMSVIPEALNMTRYEISNYSRNDYYSRHNLSCWAGVPYLGLGPGAHSLIKSDHAIQRRANTDRIRDWLRAFESHSPFPEPLFTETLTPQTHLAERLMCAARTRFFWSPQEMARRLNTPIDPFIPAIDKAVHLELLAFGPDQTYRTTSLGMALNNRLAQLFFD